MAAEKKSSIEFSKQDRGSLSVSGFAWLINLHFYKGKGVSWGPAVLWVLTAVGQELSLWCFGLTCKLINLENRDFIITWLYNWTFPNIKLKIPSNPSLSSTLLEQDVLKYSFPVVSLSVWLVRQVRHVILIVK